MGLKVVENKLKINPSIPKEWKEYSIRYRHKTSIYNIKVKNPNFKKTGIEKIMQNGIEIKDKEIMLKSDGSTNEIEVIM